MHALCQEHGFFFGGKLHYVSFIHCHKCHRSRVVPFPLSDQVNSAESGTPTGYRDMSTRYRDAPHADVSLIVNLQILQPLSVNDAAWPQWWLKRQGCSLVGYKHEWKHTNNWLVSHVFSLAACLYNTHLHVVYGTLNWQHTVSAYATANFTFLTNFT